jgi:hypothetical protein
MACHRLATPNQLRRSQEVEVFEAPGFSAAARATERLDITPITASMHVHSNSQPCMPSVWLL